jgi:hypothetical protein
MAGKPGWAIPLIAAVAIIVFLIIVSGSASAANIQGTVTDTNGAKVAGATVTLYQNGSEYDSPSNPITTDAAGSYIFRGIPVGAYSIQADKGGYFSLSDSRVLTGADVVVDLKIPGYDSKVVTPTIQVYVTPSPTPAVPTPTPTAKPTPTLVPRPAPSETPGFGLLLAIAAIGAIAAIRRYR